jgi:hypothetical protein
MAGFLDAMAEGGAELSAWKPFCGRTLSPRGVGSPATSLDLWKAARVHQHPYRAQARLLKVRNRANEILRPYGLCVSNAAMAEVLSATWHGTGKAALRAANETCRRILDRAGAYERYDGWVDTSSWPDTQVWGQYQSRHWFYRAMPGVPRRMAALVAMQARHLPAEVRQTIEANRYLGHAEERFGIDLAIRGAAERATRLRTWQAEGLLPDMGHRRVLVWKNVRAEKEDGVWFGHEHYPYRIGEPCTAAAPMACAGPFGAWRDWTRNAGKCYILALSARITDIRSDGALTLADAMPVAAYRCTKVGEGEIRLDLIEGEDVLPLIQEGI